MQEQDIWTKINDDIPLYMKDICEKYKLFCTKISPIKTALIGKKFALIVAIDRFDIGIDYLYMDGSKINVYSCGNYFAEKYDANDRINLLNGEGADIYVRNDIIINVNGLLNKWGNVLEGKTDWIESYKKSAYFSVVRLLPEEIEKIAQYMT